MKITKYIVTVFFILMTNCQSLTLYGQPFSRIEKMEKDKGLVYIYRPFLIVGGGIFYDVKSTDGKVVVDLVNGSYKPIFIKPGEITFYAATIGSASITLDIKEGETYYLKGNAATGLPPLLSNDKNG